MTTHSEILQKAQRSATPARRDATQAEQQAPGELGALVARLRAGESAAVGEFVERYGPVIRAHYRRKIGSPMRRLVDSQDLLSTIARRLCQRAANQRIRAVDHRELWALVYRIGNDALVDRVRIISRLRELEDANSPFVSGMRLRLDGEGPGSDQEFAEELERMLSLLHSPSDRELLVRWLHGESLVQIAESLGMSSPAARKRWQRIREVLAADIESERTQ